MTKTEVVQGSDGRLYLQLRKVEYPPHPSEERSFENHENQPRVVIIDPSSDEEDDVFQYYLK